MAEKITDEMINSLANLLTALQENKTCEDKFKFPSREEAFEKFWKYTTLNDSLTEMSQKELARRFFMQGTVTDVSQNEISMEEVIDELENQQFINDVKDWMDCKEKHWDAPENPFVTVIKKIYPCGECLAHQELLCEGDPECEIEVEEKININELVGEHPQVT